MGNIPDPLVIKVVRPPNPPHEISVSRLPGESEEDHVKRACRILRQWLIDNPANPPAQALVEDENGIYVEYQRGWNIDDYVSAFCNELLSLI